MVVREKNKQRNLKKGFGESSNSRGRAQRQGKSGEKTYTGSLSVTSRGSGYVSVDELPHDIRIASERLGNALNRDTVLISISRDARNEPQGKVLKVVSRARTRFVGTISTEREGRAIVPDDKRIHVTFETREKHTPGEKVYFELAEWDNPNVLPQVRILKTLGKKGDNNVEMEAIVLERGFNATFEQEAIEEAELIRERAKLSFGEEERKRKDFRNTTTFTIDPIDAKDFDDAISFKTLPGGNYEIGIHIADVSHFVQPKSVLDREAQNRGVSIYLVDRTIPMLPEALSTDLCSLNPHEDKFAFSAVFEITPEAEVVKRFFGRTIINSNKRFSYEDAQEVLDRKTGVFADELVILNGLAKKLMAERFRNGAISFEQDEVRFELDKSGHPIRVFRKERKDAHKLIEEFMLLANREVATHVNSLHKAKKVTPFFVYRIHDYPDPEKIVALGIFLKAIGYELKTPKGKVNAVDLNALFKQIEGEAEEGIIKTAAIRSMAKAIYSTNNIGHYGLGFEYYTHFTSPIRRYADVLVHRLLAEYLDGKTISPREFNFYEEMSRRVTENEIRATEAERDSIKLKQVEYMQDKIGKEFSGTISGVTEWGLYIEEKETKSEGMVKMRDLGDDYYTLDQKNYCLVGEKTKKKYSLGDSVRFKVTGADPERKTLDYKIVK